MKKTISILLTAVLLFGVAVPAFAAQSAPIEPSLSQSIPLVKVLGDGKDIYDENEQKVPKFDQALKDMLGGSEDEEDPAEDGDSTKDSSKNILLGFAKAILAGQYEEYYAILEKEIAELTEPLQMDENGDPRCGTHISKSLTALNQEEMTTPNRAASYKNGDYTFSYDWRKDPLEVADELDAYIEAVCEMTGHQQVGLLGRCLGSNFVMAYLAKYGDKGRIKGVGFDAGMVYGHTAMSESISGKFQTDGDSINRYLTDFRINYDLEYDDWVLEMIDFLERSHVLEGVGVAVKETIYEKMVEGVTRALALATYFTIPSYWSCVSAADYDDALLYVFGPEGSEKRLQYAGLIEKIEGYNTVVRQHIDEILTDFAAKGGNVGVFAKYGYQMTPICRSRNLVSDDYTSVYNASLGATTSELYNTLPDDYIRAQQEKGCGAYISPDRQIDASTCLFPDSTWFMKGICHGNWIDLEEALLYTVAIADRQLTVNDFAYTQFLVPSKETGAPEPMTADNCSTENWKAIDPETEARPSRLMRFLTSLFNMLRNLVNLIRQKLG